VLNVFFRYPPNELNCLKLLEEVVGVALRI